MQPPTPLPYFAAMNGGNKTLRNEKFVINVAHMNSWVRYCFVERRTQPGLITQVGAVEEFSLRLCPKQYPHTLLKNSRIIRGDTVTVGKINFFCA